jgi:hypothetical protein
MVHVFPRCKDPAHDKLHKLRAFMVLVQASCKAAWKLKQRQSIDEVICRFKGQTRMKSYIQKKKHKWGIKIWKATDATSGYMWAFDLYQGADASESMDVGARGVVYGVGERVVVEFVKLLPPGQPWIVYIDNYFTSVRLLYGLKQDYGVYATGTVNLWSKMFPPVLASMQASLKKAERGAYRYVMSKPGILVLSWNDAAPGAKKKCVSFASTVSGPTSSQSVERWVRRATAADSIPQPDVAQEYSANMGGVDRNNRAAEVYRTGGKTGKWWWAVFWHLIDSLIHNAWVLMYPDGAHNVPHTQFLQFKINLSKQLIGDFSCRRYERSKVVLPAPFVQHWPERRAEQERCACKCGRRVRVGCATCGVPLAVECFSTYNHGVT